MANPVTKKYLQCLSWTEEQVREVLGRGGFVDSSNNDLTSNNIHSSIGECKGLSCAQRPFELFTSHEIIEVPKEGKN